MLSPALFSCRCCNRHFHSVRERFCKTKQLNVNRFLFCHQFEQWICCVILGHWVNVNLTSSLWPVKGAPRVGLRGLAKERRLPDILSYFCPSVLWLPCDSGGSSHEPGLTRARLLALVVRGDFPQFCPELWLSKYSLQHSTTKPQLVLKMLLGEVCPCDWDTSLT